MTEVSKEIRKLLKEAKAWAKKNRGGASEIGKALGVERQTVANWISGHRTPMVEHLIALEKFLEKKRRGE
jgi:transcriptional regulator with XRE-family HTH domain